MESSSSSHWMQSAVIPSHKGLFGAKAKRAGMSTKKYAEEKKNSSNGTLAKEANLALTFEKMASHKSSSPKWSEANDDKYDKSHSIKENSSSDTKLDTRRGLSEDSLSSSLMKLRGGK